jgi:hypothetical protein
MSMLCFFEIPIGVRKRLDFYRTRFFWHSDGHKKKYRLNYSVEHRLRTKRSGGLGIEVLEIKNKCLLSKWLFKLLVDQGVWQELIQNKYLHSKSLSQLASKRKKPYSPFWKGLIKVKDDLFDPGSFTVGDGGSTRLWEDTWL